MKDNIETNNTLFTRIIVIYDYHQKQNKTKQKKYEDKEEEEKP